MDERTRNQLTGAAVWFAALIVLVGHWYSHPVDFQPGGAAQPAEERKPIVSAPLTVEAPVVPPAPPARTLPDSAPPVGQPAPKPTRETKNSPQPAAQPAQTPPAPEREKAAGWIVKVAAYFTARQANELVAALNEAGYDATYKKFRNKKGQTVYSVRVGPYSSREAAEAAKRQIDRRWRANGYIEKLTTEK